MMIMVVVNLAWSQKAVAMDNVPDTHGSVSVEVRQAIDHIGSLFGKLLSGNHDTADEKGAAKPGSSAAEAEPDIRTADALRGLAAELPGESRREEATTHEREQIEEKQRIKLLLKTHLDQAMWNDILSRMQPAAKRGERELLLLSFPSDLCDDGGRKIRVGEDGWEDTLRGEAADLRARWTSDLVKKGYGLKARMLDYEGGMPGNIGLFLSWSN